MNVFRLGMLVGCSVCGVLWLVLYTAPPGRVFRLCVLLWPSVLMLLAIPSFGPSGWLLLVASVLANGLLYGVVGQLGSATTVSGWLLAFQVVIGALYVLGTALALSVLASFAGAAALSQLAAVALVLLIAPFLLITSSLLLAFRSQGLIAAGAGLIGALGVSLTVIVTVEPQARTLTQNGEAASALFALALVFAAVLATFSAVVVSLQAWRGAESRSQHDRS